MSLLHQLEIAARYAEPFKAVKGVKPDVKSLHHGPHPNVMTGVMSPRARALSVDIEAAHERMAQIVAARASGESVIQIALRFELSRERVYQILRKAASRARKKAL